MFCRSTRIELRPDWTSLVNRSPSSFDVVLSSRPYASTTVTLSVTPSTNFMWVSPLRFLQFLPKTQLVDTVAPRIFQLIGQLAHEVQTDAAHLAGLGRQVGICSKQRIEWLAVVRDDHLDAAIPQLDSDHDVMVRRVLVGVRDDVVEDFIERHIQRDH